MAAVAITTIQRESGTISKRIADNPKPAGPEKESLAEATVEEIPEPRVEMEVAQEPAAPQATTAPNTTNEFREEKQRPALDASAGKTRGLALNPSAPAPMPMKRAYNYVSGGGETTEAEPPSGYRQGFSTATYDKVEGDAFLPAATHPLSTFSLAVCRTSVS